MPEPKQPDSELSSDSSEFFSMLGYNITFKLILNRMGKEFCLKD